MCFWSIFHDASLWSFVPALCHYLYPKVSTVIVSGVFLHTSIHCYTANVLVRLHLDSHISSCHHNCIRQTDCPPSTQSTWTPGDGDNYTRDLLSTQARKHLQVNCAACRPEIRSVGTILCKSSRQLPRIALLESTAFVQRSWTAVAELRSVSSLFKTQNNTLEH